MSRVRFEPKPCGRYSCLLHFSHEGSLSSLSSVAFVMVCNYFDCDETVNHDGIDRSAGTIYKSNARASAVHWVSTDCEKQSLGFEAR